MNESSFLKQIVANPQDLSIRLIYADWLEEAGDVRAELIRIEEEMKSIPIASDRYWELKPRRNELRGCSEGSWLKLMRFGTDYHPVFTEVPTDWMGRWRVVREFIDRWYGIPMEDVGGNLEAVRAIEAKLNRVLPASVREWISLTEDIHRQDRVSVFRDCVSVEEVEFINSLSLLLQGEGDIYWAVNQANLGLDDPPVDWFWLDYDSPKAAWMSYGQFASCVTGFVMRYLNMYLDLARNAGSFTIDNVPGDFLTQASSAFDVLTRFDEIRVFEAKNRIALLCRSWLSSGEEVDLRVFVKEGQETEEIPPVLRELATQSRSASGIFANSRHRPSA